jgi:hypothetical protein
MLTFELANDKDELEIHCDKKGLKDFIQILSKVLEKGEHEHLMSPSWGGTELSHDKQGENNILLNHVKVLLWK